MSLGKGLFGVMAGIAFGVLLGVLFVRVKGSDTARNKTPKKGEDRTKALKGKLNESLGGISEKSIKTRRKNFPNQKKLKNDTKTVRA